MIVNETVESMKRWECISLTFYKIELHSRMNIVTIKLRKCDIMRIEIRARMCVASERKWKSLHQDNARPDIKFDGARLEDGFRPNKIKVCRKSNPSASILIIPSDRMLSSTRGVIIFDLYEFKAFNIIEEFAAHLDRRLIKS